MIRTVQVISPRWECEGIDSSETYEYIDCQCEVALEE